MRPDEIIYWNQYSGLTELCKRTEMKYTRELDIYKTKVPTERVVQELFLNGAYVFDIRSRDIATFAEPGVFSYSDFLAGKPRMNIPIVMAATFTLVEKTDDYVDIHLTESFENGEPTDIGFIKFHRNINEPINGCKGKAAIIIHDVKMNKGSKLTLSAFGMFALGVGLFVLAIMDGDWQRIGKDLNNYLRSPEYEIKNLNAKLKEFETKYFDLKTQFESEQKESLRLIQNLQRTIREQSAQISELKNQNQHLKVLLRENVPAELPPIIQQKRDYVAELKEKLEGKKICVIGGSSKWQKKFLEEFADAIILENEVFDENQIKNSDLLIVNTNFIGHSFTKKAVDIAAQNQIKICYTSKNNLPNISKDLLSKLLGLS